jgi:hypothetical protein
MYTVHIYFKSVKEVGFLNTVLLNFWRRRSQLRVLCEHCLYLLVITVHVWRLCVLATGSIWCVTVNVVVACMFSLLNMDS